MRKLLTLFLLLHVVFSFGQLPSYLPANGLVGWWPFNGNAYDGSGNGNTGVLVNVIPAADRMGNPNAAYSFNGTNSYIDIADAASLRVRRITASIWVKSNTTQMRQIIYKGSMNATGEAYSMSHAGFGFKSNSNCTPAVGWKGGNFKASLGSGSWIHLVATYDGDLLKLFQNGSLDTSYTIPGLIDSCFNGGLRFGFNHLRYFASTGDPFDGILDDVAIWNRALTLQEVTTLYIGGNPLNNCTAKILNNDTTVIAGSTVTLIADSSSFGTPRPAMLWSTGSTTTRTTIAPTVSATYTLRVTTGGISCYDSVKVNVAPLNSFIIRAGNQLLCGPVNITPNNIIDVPVTVNTFNSMVGFQGSIKWDSTVLRYQSISSFSSGIGLSSSNFNNPAANTLVYSWVDGTLAGKSLPDNSVLFTIRFTPAASAWGRSTAISFDNTPTPLEAVRQPATLLGVTPQAGTVHITSKPLFDTTRLSGCGTVQYNGASYTSSTTLNSTQRGANGCDSIYRTVIITINPGPVLNGISVNSPVLIGETIRLTASGQNLDSATFSWTGPNGFTSILQNPTLVATALSGGQYRLIYTSNCERDTQTVSVTVNAGISGRIVSPLSQPISQVNLLRNNVPLLVTGSSYSIAVSPNIPLVLKAAKNNDVDKLNGVSVLDIVLIQNHVLQRGLLNSPYKLIAADVNRSNSITTLDLVLMQRLILGLDTTLPGNTLWAFADSSYTFPNPSNPFPYKDSFSYTSANLQSNRVNQTFIGMKLGDVNYDWNYLQLRPVPTEEVVLYHDDVQASGSEVRIPIKVKNLKELLGMQFTLQYNSSALRFRTIENNRLNLKYGNTRSGEGLLAFIWSDNQNLPATLNDDVVLMELVFDKTGEFTREDIQLVNTIATIEAWDKNYRKHNVIKGRGRILNNTKPGAPGWTVSPNPTSGQVVVNLTLQKAQSVELYLTTADGRVLKNWKQTFTAGTSAWPLDLKSGGYLPVGMYWMKMPGVDAVVRKIVVE